MDRSSFFVAQENAPARVQTETVMQAQAFERREVRKAIGLLQKVEESQGATAEGTASVHRMLGGSDVQSPVPESAPGEAPRTCDICNSVKLHGTVALPCCKGTKVTCTDCLGRLSGRDCPFCRQTLPLGIGPAAAADPAAAAADAAPEWRNCLACGEPVEDRDGVPCSVDTCGAVIHFGCSKTPLRPFVEDGGYCFCCPAHHDHAGVSSQRYIKMEPVDDEEDEEVCRNAQERATPAQRAARAARRAASGAGATQAQPARSAAAPPPPPHSLRAAPRRAPRANARLHTPRNSTPLPRCAACAAAGRAAVAHRVGWGFVGRQRRRRHAGAARPLCSRATAPPPLSPRRAAPRANAPTRGAACLATPPVCARVCSGLAESRRCTASWTAWRPWWRQSRASSFPTCAS